MSSQEQKTRQPILCAHETAYLAFSLHSCAVEPGAISLASTHSCHQVIRWRSGHQITRSSSDHQVIKSSGHQATKSPGIRASGHQGTRTSGHQVIRSLGHQMGTPRRGGQDAQQNAAVRPLGSILRGRKTPECSREASGSIGAVIRPVRSGVGVRARQRAAAGT
eukprot:1360530-Prymnesium_polylepis.1